MRIGVAGTGIMGRATAERLLARGHSVVVWNRTYDHAKPVVAAGAGWVDSPHELARRCQIVLSFLTDPAAVAGVSLGPDGIVSGLDGESVHADMSTVSPESADRLAARYAALGRRFVQAPVLGSRKQIMLGHLLVFAGGSEDDVARCQPAFESLAAGQWRFDSAGRAAAVKLACNLLLAHTIVGIGQSLLFSEAAGVEPATLLDILGRSAMASSMLTSKGQAVVRGDFTPNFFVRHMEKDLGLAQEAAAALDTTLPPNDVTRRLFQNAIADGLGEEDYSAVVKALRETMGVNRGT